MKQLLHCLRIFSTTQVSLHTSGYFLRIRDAKEKGKIQLIDASIFNNKLRKALGDKKNEISPENRSEITKLYADFA